MRGGDKEVGEFDVDNIEGHEVKKSKSLIKFHNEKKVALTQNFLKG